MRPDTTKRLKVVAVGFTVINVASLLFVFGVVFFDPFGLEVYDPTIYWYVLGLVALGIALLTVAFARLAWWRAGWGVPLIALGVLEALPHGWALVEALPMFWVELNAVDVGLFFGTFIFWPGALLVSGILFLLAHRLERRRPSPAALREGTVRQRTGKWVRASGPG